MDKEQLELYIKLQNLYIDTYDHLYGNKSYFKALEQFTMIYHCIEDYLNTNNVDDATLMLHLKDKCQHNMASINQYLYSDNNIVIEEKEDENINVEDSIEELDVIQVETPSFLNLISKLFPCFEPSQLEQLLFKRLKEKTD